MTETIQHQYRFEGISPALIFEAYMDTKSHKAFTQSSCTISREVNGRSSMYDGYCHAINLSLNPGKRIEQQWWAHEDAWPEGHRSRIILELAESGPDTVLTFTQEEVPVMLSEQIEKGWFTYYWNPLAIFLQSETDES